MLYSSTILFLRDVLSTLTYQWIIYFSRGICLDRLGLVAVVVVCILVPHAGVSQLREPHPKLFAAVSESQLQLTSVHAEFVIDCQRFQNQVLSIFHQLASDNDHIGE